MLHQISENEINVRNNTAYPRNTVKINNKIIEKIYTSKTTSTQTVKDRDDRMCELMERAFHLELANKKLKKIVSSEHKNTIKLRSELIKLRTRDAIMKSKMDETNRNLMEQTSRYNILQEQIQQVVSLAAIGSVNNNTFSSPTRTTSRVSFSSATFPNTPKMPVCGIEDDIMSPVREEEEYTNGIDILNANNNKNSMNDSHNLSTSNSSSISSAAIDIPQKLKGPQPPLPENSNTGTTAFSYIDAMRFLMSPPTNNSLISGGNMENKYGSMYGTTPLTNEQLNFQQIITNAETNAMKQKIEVVKEMYKKENNELKLRIANLEQRVKVTEEKASKYQHKLAKANVVIEEQNKVLKSTKSVMNSFEIMDENNSNNNGKSIRRNSKTGSRRISQMKLIQAKVNKSRNNQQMLFESSGGGRKGYYGRLGLF